MDEEVAANLHHLPWEECGQSSVVLSVDPLVAFPARLSQGGFGVVARFVYSDPPWERTLGVSREDLPAGVDVEQHQQKVSRRLEAVEACLVNALSEEL